MRLLPGTKLGRGILAAAALAIAAVPAGLLYCVVMPGTSFEGERPALNEDELVVKKRLEEHVRVLADEIVQRDVQHPESLAASEEYLRSVWGAQGLEVLEQEYSVGGVAVRNLEVEFRGRSRPGEIVIVGAHYDSHEIHAERGDVLDDVRESRHRVGNAVEHVIEFDLRPRDVRRGAFEVGPRRYVVHERALHQRHRKDRHSVRRTVRSGTVGEGAEDAFDRVHAARPFVGAETISFSGRCP